MAAPRRCVDLRISDNEVAWLGRMARSRRKAASRVERGHAAALPRRPVVFRRRPGARCSPSDGAALRTSGRCAMAWPRPWTTARDRDGRRRSPGRRAPGWSIWPAARPRTSAYPHELWTTQLLARHARERPKRSGHPCRPSLLCPWRPLRPYFLHKKRGVVLDADDRSIREALEVIFFLHKSFSRQAGSEHTVSEADAGGVGRHFPYKKWECRRRRRQAPSSSALGVSSVRRRVP